MRGTEAGADMKGAEAGAAEAGARAWLIPWPFLGPGDHFAVSGW